MKAFVQKDALVWVLTRQHIRSGTGPIQVLVAEVSQTAGLFRARGNRGWYGDKEVFEAQPEAVTAWHERATAEHNTERARYNKIAARLMVWDVASSEHKPTQQGASA